MTQRKASVWNMALLAVLVVGFGEIAPAHSAETEPPNWREPANDAELRYWLENMIWYHGFSNTEIAEATGLSESDIVKALNRFEIRPDNRPPRQPNAPLLVLPYPGGRHPRIGFLEGAIRPQRETKISVFPPWVFDAGRSGSSPHSQNAGYFVVDVPEAIWSNLGLTYLAHTHVATVWTEQNVELEKLEWNRRDDGTLDFQRRLPNGIQFGAKVVPQREAVRMELWLLNGTDQLLTRLRVQNCIMLKAAAGFNEQSNDNKVLKAPYAACRSSDGKRWIITCWKPCYRAWANPPCPCLHSDPQFPDCAPGETKRVRGWISFYEGNNLESELERIEGLNWWQP